MGLYRAGKTLRWAAFGPAVLIACVACVALCCPADLRGQQDSPAPDEPPASQPPASPPSEPPADAVPAPPPPNPSADTDKWADTPRDLPQDQGFTRRRWGSEVRSMGYTASEVLIVALIGVPAAVLGVYGLRVLVRWMEGRKLSRNTADDSRRNRQEYRAWRQELRSWRSTHRGR